MEIPRVSHDDPRHDLNERLREATGGDDDGASFVEPPRELWLDPNALESGWVWDPTAGEGYSCAVASDGRVSNLSETDVGRPPADWLRWEKPGEAEDTVQETAAVEQEISKKLNALGDMAAKNCTAEVLAMARQEMREWMRNHGVGRPLEAMTIRLKEMGPATVNARGLIVYAARELLDEGRANRGDVPTMDAPAGDVGGKGKKGKRAKGAKSATGPKKNKRSVAWVAKLGANAVGFRASFAPAEERLLEMIQAGSFARRPEEIMSSPEYGFCPIDDPSIGTSELSALPSIGSDPEWVVWGLRRDAKTGCPTHRFRYEAEHEATAEALAKGYANASGAAIKERVDAKVSAWYRTATPQTTVIPLAWHRPTWTLYVFSDNAEAVSAAQMRAAKTLGALNRVPTRIELIPATDIDKCNRTSIRSEETETTGPADLPADLLLWLVGRQLGGTGVIQLGDGTRIEWWADDAVECERSGADEKKLRVKLGGAPAEGGSLAAALADGAVLRSARIAIRVDEQTWKVTLGSGAPKSWKLPVLGKPDGTPAGLDSVVDERLRLWQRGERYLLALLEVAIGDRLDRSAWRQRVGTLRQLLGVEIVKRWGFDPATKQGVLFAHMLQGAGGEQTTLGSVVVEDKRAKKSRAEKAAEAAGA